MADKNESETIVFYGGEVKALGDGRIGGYLVRFSGPDEPDLVGDYFDAETDFGEVKQSPVYYQHGMDKVFKTRRLGKAELTTDEFGIWAETQLQLRDDYERHLEKMAAAGKMGWSSGTASHLVTREKKGKAWHITGWPLGLDASLTPTPAEPRNSAIPLKSLRLQDEPEGAGDAREVEQAKEIGDKKSSEEGTQEVTHIMDEKESKEEVIQAVDSDALIDAAVDKALKAFEARQAERQVTNDPGYSAKRVSIGKTGLGDSEEKAYLHFLKTGDYSKNMKASNDTDMNIGTAADGGHAVPAGHYNQIIAKRDEMALMPRLGIRPIPGIGTTVSVPLDNEADGEFVSTAEATGFDRDAPALGNKDLTLVKYTKKVELSVELLNDEGSNLMPWLSDFVARGMAKTHNNLILTEVASNGTEFDEFASATVIATGEPENIVYNADLSAYLDDSSGVAWVMRPPTYGQIVSITGNPRVYGETPAGSRGDRQLLDYPVFFSQKAAAQAASAKSVYFGNWNYVGWREAPGFTVLRDPYSKASSGQLVLHYYFRFVAGVLQAEAIGFGAQATA